MSVFHGASKADHLGVNPQAENRFRECIERDCGKSFKKPHEAEYRCEACRARIEEMQRLHGVHGQLQDANAKVKP